MNANEAAGPSERPCAHLHYGSGQLQLDLALQSRTETACLEVSGALLDEASGCLERVPAYLLSGSEIVDEAMTDRRGSFHLATRARERLRLCLLLADDRLVELELRRARRNGWAARPSERSS